ncbi:MAG: hypothetical protein IT453_18325 [Planctomycetes bacterium]|nr:hypothetical protein [Planctomycetota bacterium]
MKSLALSLFFALVATLSADAQSFLYEQPMSPNGGTLRNSQLWVDPSGQNDLDSDAIAWEDFTLPQTTTITKLRWWGQTAPPLGFMVSFFNQDPNTIACQPDIFAAGSHPISEETYTTFTQVSVGGSMYQFEITLVTPLVFNGLTRYFVSVVGLTPIPYATWSWAQSPVGTNGTFWWMRGAHMYFHLADERAVALDGTPVAGCTAPSIYCTTKTNSLWCNPAIGYTGSPTASGSTAFHVTGVNFINKKSGLLFYGSTPNGVAFQGGTLCVKLPITRTSVQSSGGSTGTSDCSGTYDYDFESLILAGTDPSLVTGAKVYAQYWSRDPAAVSTTSLSNAVAFEICP